MNTQFKGSNAQRNEAWKKKTAPERKAATIVDIWHTTNIFSSSCIIFKTSKWFFSRLILKLHYNKKMWKLLSLCLLLLTLLRPGWTKRNRCPTRASSCDECIQAGPQCAWCSQPFSSIHCQTPEALQRQGCPKSHIYNPRGEVPVVKISSRYSIYTKFNCCGPTRTSWKNELKKLIVLQHWCNGGRVPRHPATGVTCTSEARSEPILLPEPQHVCTPASVTAAPFPRQLTAGRSQPRIRQQLGIKHAACGGQQIPERNILVQRKVYRLS